jgi:hypothetical protein
MSLAETTDSPSWEDTTSSAPHRAGGVDHGHDRHDGHVHEHDGHVHTEAKPPTVPSRAVMIDVGATKGALILDSRAELEGVEVEIHLVSEPTKRTHVWVLPREGRDGVIYAAIFPSLSTGEYAILGRDGSVASVVNLPPNTITHATWD